MRRYLFIGGPRDGQWAGVPDEYGAHPFLVSDPGRDFLHWRYHRRSVWVPGWLFPIDLYVLDGVTEIERSTVLPGFAYGQMTAWPTTEWSIGEQVRSLRAAVTAFNRERLAR